MTIEPKFFEARDVVRLAGHEMGEGAPIILLHGLLSSGEVIWIKFRTAAPVAAEGCRVIMPDLRDHRCGDAPHGVGNYAAALSDLDSDASVRSSSGAGTGS